MAVPKIDRESGLFEKNVCDKINKKVQILTDNTLALYVPTLAPYYQVNGIPLHLETTRLVSGYTTSSTYTDESGNTHTQYVEYQYTGDLSIEQNNSFSIGNEDARVNILNFTMKIKNIVYSYRTKVDSGSWSSWTSTSKPVYYDIAAGASPKMFVGKIDRAPICDMWFATENGGCIVNVPQGTNKLYIIPNGVDEINVYCWYV